MAIIQGAGGTIHQKKLSRVDMCLDLPGVGMEDFIAAYKEQRYICRANNRGYMESNGVTLYLGKHPLQLRIYDKVAQLVMANDPLKFMLMQERRWHAIQQNEATRVEFEIGREALKDRGIDTPEDYFKKRADLISCLCHEWVRFTAQAVDRTSTSRAEVLPLWLKVEKGFQDWLGLPVGESLEALDRGSVDVRMLARQAIGVMMTAAVIQGLTFKHEERLIGYVDRSFRRELASMDISGEMARRQTQLGS
jgi:hypothetical protein